MTKTVLLAGATSMIGRALAALLSRKGWELILLGRDEAKLSQLAASLESKAHIYPLDMSSPELLEERVEEMVSAFKTIDAFVYNTAIYPWARITELSLEDWNKTLTTNLTAAFILTKALAPIMQRQNSGKIVYASSSAGEDMGLPHMSVYGASKAGLNGFMRTAALELASYNIQVNAMSPGKMWNPEELTEEEIAHKLRPVPLKRFTAPEDAAHMIAFLLSEEANHITGQNFTVDGGQSIIGEDAHTELS